MHPTSKSWLLAVILLLQAVSVSGSFWRYYKERNSTYECSSFHSKSNQSTRCAYISSLEDCRLEDGFIQYIMFVYCSIPQNATPVAFVILGFWLVYMFIALGVTAEDFFCPCLKSISKTLHMSDSVAGVTLLALGNGAPDIFSVLAAITPNGSHNTAPMAFQELFGAGMFVTTIVAAVLHIRASFQLARRPYLRDLVFFLAAVGWTFAVIYKMTIGTLEAVGFIALYVVYVVIVIVGQVVNRKMRLRRASISATATEEVPTDRRMLIPDINSSVDFSSIVYSGHYTHQSQHSGSNPEAPESFIERLLGFRQCLWKQKSMMWKLYTLSKVPVSACLGLTVPVVDEDAVNLKWNKYLICIQLFASPLFCAFAVEKAFVPVYHQFQVWHLLICVGALLCALVFYATRPESPPKLFKAFAFAGFAVSVIWIYALATEIVNLLETFGWIFRMSYAIMGLSFLAVGNSLGDFVANLSVARHGAPRMAIAACYGGPLLNVLLGVGLSCTISAVSNQGHIRLIHDGRHYIISAAFLAASLICAAVVMPAMMFKSSKIFGVFLILLYVAYVTVSILNEVHVIH